jgi:hypothetical protein
VELKTRPLHQAELARWTSAGCLFGNGKEEIITDEIPYTYDLFRLFQENGWLNVRRGVSSIRESRAQGNVCLTQAWANGIKRKPEPEGEIGSGSPSRSGTGMLSSPCQTAWEIEHLL